MTHKKSSGKIGAKLLTILLATSTSANLAIAKPVGKKSVKASSNYSVEDFYKIRKFDAHVHANTASTIFVDQAKKDNFEILSINVDYPDFPPIDTQYKIAKILSKYDAKRFFYAATFSMDNYQSNDWVKETNLRIENSVKSGAKAIKIWKNIGMVVTQKDGSLLRIDNPVFDPIIAKVKKTNVPLIVHAGEPHNCWLPLDKMTNDNDREYFREHPNYHMALHPEQPSYEDQMGARDNFLRRNQNLKFVGAHMASLEWNVDRLAKFLDEFPNARVDLAARMTEVQYQSNHDYEKVRAFFIKYQDRLMYGSDLTMNPETDEKMPAQNPPNSGLAEFGKVAHDVWLSDWKYLATNEAQNIQQIHANVEGLALPKGVIDKIFYKNARLEFFKKSKVN